jgi:hypothetical protein
LEANSGKAREFAANQGKGEIANLRKFSVAISLKLSAPSFTLRVLLL